MAVNLLKPTEPPAGVIRTWDIAFDKASATGTVETIVRQETLS
jgi:hypothetical protein